MGLCIMSFISNAVGLIRGKKTASGNQNEEKNEAVGIPTDDIQTEETSSVVNVSDDFDFSLRNYAKESFSVLIQKPFSACMLKMMRVMTSVTAGILSGTVISIIACVVFLQFGSIENTVISSFITSKFDKLFPDSELNIKSANFAWNPELKSFEIDMNRVRINDFLIPHISIQPDYLASLKAQTLIAKTISITNPKISVDVKDDWKHAAVNPNFGMKSGRKSAFVPVQELTDFKHIMNADTTLRIVNADVCILHNNDAVTMQNVYCEYNALSKLPQALAATLALPGQKAKSSFNLKHVRGNDYKLKLTSLNPDALMQTLLKMNISVDQKVASLFDGYNLPVSGNVNLKFNKELLPSGDFELTGGNGSVRLPSNSMFALNLGKKIDHGEISGSFSPKEASIDSLHANYENSGLQLTGIKIPLKNYKFLDKANIDGTLSMTNIDVGEVESILPEKIASTAVLPLKRCLPGFKLEEFRVDLKGPVSFDDNGANGLKIGQGVFTVKDAKIAVGPKYIDHVNASGVVMSDGIDIKIANAEFNKIKINQGILYIASKDGAAIGNMNIDLPVDQVSRYAQEISPKLAQLPLDKLGIKGLANLDVKVISLNDDKSRSSEFPFKVVQGNGFISSDMNARKLKVSWDNKGVSLSGDVKVRGGKATIQFDEDYEKNTAHSLLKFLSKSDFLTAFIPGVDKILDGNFILTLNTDWKNNNVQDSELVVNLKNATMFTPFTGNLKNKASDGKFTAHVVKHDGVFDFTNINFAADDNKFTGTMTVNEKGDVIRCSFPDFVVNGASAKLQVLNKDKNQMFLSAIGNNLNIKQLQTFLGSQKSDMTASMYINLQEVKYGTDKLRNVQGTVDVKNGKIVGGACYGILGKDTTVTLAAKKVKGKNITTISASNAGEVLRHFRLSDSVEGGNINIVLNERGGADSQSGAFEITNCIVKDSALLAKMVSLSSVNLLPATDNLTVGFNRCTGKFVLADKKIVMDKFVALSPSFAVAFSGKYDRVNDTLDVTGNCLQMSSYYTATGDEVLLAPFVVTGSLSSPSISVNPIEYMERGNVTNMFGNLLPVSRKAAAKAKAAASADNVETIMPVYDDPFVQGAFDKNAFDKKMEEFNNIQEVKVTTANQTEVIETNNATSKNPQDPKNQRKHGVTIVRGQAR